jgi:hypothetical protein
VISGKRSWRTADVFIKSESVAAFTRNARKLTRSATFSTGGTAASAGGGGEPEAASASGHELMGEQVQHPEEEVRTTLMEGSQETG